MEHENPLAEIILCPTGAHFIQLNFGNFIQLNFIQIKLFKSDENDKII